MKLRETLIKIALPANLIYLSACLKGIEELNSDADIWVKIEDGCLVIYREFDSYD